MRVIAGMYKGAKLLAPVNNKVRPTTDRIKETIFNILYSKGLNQEIIVLDLFGGSGALGIEALSRGARNVVFVDNDRESINLIKKNLSIIKAEAEVYNTDYSVALKKLSGRKFDLIICDPPYALRKEPEIFDLILKYDILSQFGIIFVEHSKENDLNFALKNFIIDTRICGNTCISFLRRKNDNE